MNEAADTHPSQPTAGAILRHAREEAGLHVASLAGLLKVPQRQLEALEHDRLDELPDVVYARALAASVCRNLKLDPRPVLERLPRGGDSRLGRDEPINLPFRSQEAPSSGGIAGLLRRPAVVAALVLVLAAAVLLLLPLLPQDTPPESAGPGVPVPVPASAPGVVTEAVQPALPAAAEPSAAAAASQGPSSAPAAPASVASGPAAVDPPAGGPGAPPAAPVTPPAGAPMIEFRATQPSWVSVTDARGAVLLRRTLSAGEQVPLNGVAPLSVTVGSASSVQVLVRGRPQELTPARDNVARFEVR